MPINPTDLEHILLYKFDFSEAKQGRDHKWYELQLEGLPVIMTKISHSNNEIHTRLEGKIARQMRVRAPFFKQMISCTRSREQYYAQVRVDPYPPFDFVF